MDLNSDSSHLVAKGRWTVKFSILVLVSLSGKYGHYLICRASVGIQEKTVHDTVKWYIRVQCHINTIIRIVRKLPSKNVGLNSEVKGGELSYSYPS